MVGKATDAPVLLSTAPQIITLVGWIRDPFASCMELAAGSRRRFTPIAMFIGDCDDVALVRYQKRYVITSQVASL